MTNRNSFLNATSSGSCRPLGLVFRVSSFLYIITVLAHPRGTHTYVYQEAVLPALLSVLLLEGVLQLCREGVSYLRNSCLHVIDMVALGVGLGLVIGFGIAGRGAPPSAQYAGALVRFVKVVRDVVAADRREMRANSKANSKAGKHVSARLIVFTFGEIMLAFGAMTSFEGVITYMEVEGSVALHDALGPMAVDSIMSGGGLVLIGAVSALAAQLSGSKEVTLLVMSVSTVSVVLLAWLVPPDVDGFSRAVTAGRAHHFDEAAADDDALVTWRALQFGFTHAWTSCAGAVYNTSRVRSSCAARAPWHPCSEAPSDRMAVYCSRTARVAGRSSALQTMQTVQSAVGWGPALREALRAWESPAPRAAGSGGGAGEEGGAASDEEDEEDEEDEGRWDEADPDARNGTAFGLLMSSLCMREPASALAARARSPSQAACEASGWWKAPPLSAESRRMPRQELQPVFALLGGADLEMSAKRLFCLCEGSPGYRRVIDLYVGAMHASWLLMIVFVLTMVTFLLCFCCQCQDGGQYYDPELL